jgi:Tfp pilus assembly PilM family ATPase
MAFFSKFLDRDEQMALGVDMGSSAIKIVQLKKKNGQAVLETYGELADIRQDRPSSYGFDEREGSQYHH